MWLAGPCLINPHNLALPQAYGLLAQRQLPGGLFFPPVQDNQRQLSSSQANSCIFILMDRCAHTVRTHTSRRRHVADAAMTMTPFKVSRVF